MRIPDLIAKLRNKPLSAWAVKCAEKWEVEVTFRRPDTNAVSQAYSYFGPVSTTDGTIPEYKAERFGLDIAARGAWMSDGYALLPSQIISIRKRLVPAVEEQGGQ